MGWPSLFFWPREVFLYMCSQWDFPDLLSDKYVILSLYSSRAQLLPLTLSLKCLGETKLQFTPLNKFQLLCPEVHLSSQFSAVTQSCPTLCNPMDCSLPGLPVHHQLPEFTQTCVHWVGDVIQSSHSLSSPSPPAFNLSQHQGLFQWVSSLHQVAKVLEFQLQHQSFQWTPRTDL